MSQSHLVLDREGAPHIESVQDIKACVRAANFTGATEQHTLLTYMTMKSRVQGFALRLAARSIRDDAHVASDSLGMLHVAHFVGLGTTSWASSPSATALSSRTSRTSQKRLHSPSMPSSTYEGGPSTR